MSAPRKSSLLSHSMNGIAASQRAAFTLIEMLIVIGLIAAIMSIVVVNFGGPLNKPNFN